MPRYAIECKVHQFMDGRAASASSGTAKQWVETFNVVVDGGPAEDAIETAKIIAMRMIPRSAQVLTYACKTVSSDTPLTVVPDAPPVNGAVVKEIKEPEEETPTEDLPLPPTRPLMDDEDESDEEKEARKEAALKRIRAQRAKNNETKRVKAAARAKNKNSDRAKLGLE